MSDGGVDVSRARAFGTGWASVASRVLLADRLLTCSALALSSGNFGVVSVVKNAVDGQLYVLKEIDLTKLDDGVKRVSVAPPSPTEPATFPSRARTQWCLLNTRDAVLTHIVATWFCAFSLSPFLLSHRRR